jgi:integrase
MTIEQLVHDFLADRQAKVVNRELSPKTVREYRGPLQRVLLPFCSREGIVDVVRLDKLALEKLRTELIAKDLATPTVNSYLRSVNVALNWAREERGQETRTVKLVKQDRIERETLTRDEITRMENAAGTERDKLIIRVLADTGIRVGELVNLRVVDIVERDGEKFIRARGKTGERLVPIPKLYVRLRRFATETKPKRAANDRVFMAERRRRGAKDLAALTESGVQQVVRELAETAGVSRDGRPVHPHLFRHSFMTYQLQRDMHPMQLKRIVGHKSTKMIDEIYEHLGTGDAYRSMVRTLGGEES